MDFGPKNALVAQMQRRPKMTELGLLPDRNGEVTLHWRSKNPLDARRIRYGAPGT
jgi:hypothetical protein